MRFHNLPVQAIQTRVLSLLLTQFRLFFSFLQIIVRDASGRDYY